ncbi:MAG TPA: 3-dehydroquinate synthase, partial [Candidatus Dormibacteraeota bacterium]|nr:3-dehydroquinate synthase [Candidatus Dormibacteraeota bacterium]
WHVDTLTVALGNRSYPILIDAGLLARAESFGGHLAARDVLIVSNTTVAPLYLPALTAALGGRRVVEVLLPDGEAHKTLGNAARVLDVLIANRFGRDCALVALGGGVVGDLTGFAAACYQRGVALVQVPTTLLAQVDSAVGGKTAVNHPGGKNLIGAFHQPALVVADTSTLATLPPRELRAGLAEVIKYGLICDPALFAWLEAHLERVLAHEPAALAHVVRRSCEIKAAIVARDEREQGERALLNLGHTFGHALESATAYKEYLHGEAVGAGLVMAAVMSAACGLMPLTEATRVQRLIERAGLPTGTGTVSVPTMLEHMAIDKKVLGGRLRLVLLRGIGQAFLSADYPAALLERTLAQHSGPPP